MPSHPESLNELLLKQYETTSVTSFRIFLVLFAQSINDNGSIRSSKYDELAGDVSSIVKGIKVNFFIFKHEDDVRLQ
ncbi:unnamed protein product [Rotaria sp. Silwood2]|nr:unnamed protein product [Rotaria sp. Silwood2]CAF4290775.1 unnamed protein product [Rotaria sp. Silwood2]